MKELPEPEESPTKKMVIGKREARAIIIGVALITGTFWGVVVWRVVDAAAIQGAISIIFFGTIGFGLWALTNQFILAVIMSRLDSAENESTSRCLSDELKMGEPTKTETKLNHGSKITEDLQMNSPLAEPSVTGERKKSGRRGFGIGKCANCGLNVIPTSDGQCPSCRRPFEKRK